MKPSIFISAVFVSAALSAFAHEGVGRAGFKDARGIELETEIYSGKGGYFHAGVGVVAEWNERQTIGVVGHVAREETGGDLFPSIGAEFIQDIWGGELEAFAFGYLPVRQQHAWGVGLRGSRHIDINENLVIRPFFGPTYANVQAWDEVAESTLTIDHLMLLGGVSVEMGTLELTVFGSLAFFNEDTSGLETHVDLEEMTHFGAYENNDGFANNSVGMELSYAATDWLTLSASYALIHFEDETRHSIAFAPSFKLGSNAEFFVGIQLLRGDGKEDNLAMTGVSVSF